MFLQNLLNHGEMSSHIIVNSGVGVIHQKYQLMLIRILLKSNIDYMRIYHFSLVKLWEFGNVHMAENQKFHYFLTMTMLIFL